MHIINSLAPNTASGWDGIGPQLVRDNCQLFLEPLEYLFNSFLFIYLISLHNELACTGTLSAANAAAVS